MKTNPIWTWLLVCTALATSQSVIAGAQRAWNFEVLLDGKVIGQHRFELYEQNARRHVAINANFDVRVLFFNAYHYRHNNYEVWHEGCLQSISSQTDDNGDKAFVSGKLQDGVLQIRTESGENSFSGCISTFAYWDLSSILQSRALLNAQTGELQPVQVRALGTNTIQVRGKPMQARHYQIETANFTIELWYSLQQQWLALQSTTSNGTVLHYQLQ